VILDLELPNSVLPHDFSDPLRYFYRHYPSAREDICTAVTSFLCLIHIDQSCEQNQSSSDNWVRICENLLVLVAMKA